MATSADSVENKVCLIRHRTQQISDGDTTSRLRLFANDMNLSSWEPPSNSQLGPGVELSAYIDQLKKSKNVALFGMSIYSPKRIVRIVFAELFMQNLCRMLPLPFFQIVGWFEESGGNGGRKHNFSKRFGLHDILSSGKMDGAQVFEEYFCAAVTCGRGRCIFSIQLGWMTQPITDIIQLSPSSLSLGLLDNEATKELTLVAANGAEIKCHKVIVSAQSAVLTAMVTTTGLKESEEGRIDFLENSEEGIHLLLRYLYGFELDPKEIPPELVVELFQTAHKYDLAHLQESLHKFLLDKDEKWFAPDVLLELYFYTRNVDEFGRLRDHALLLTTRIKTGVFRSSEGFRKLDKATVTELLGEQIKLFQEGIAK